jgi:hypothetical protein
MTRILEFEPELPVICRNDPDPSIVRTPTNSQPAMRELKA